MKRRHAAACVLLEWQVYDVSKFLKEHPGGSTIILPHLGTEINEILDDEDMHVHSKAAHSMMARYRIGTTAFLMLLLSLLLLLVSPLLWWWPLLVAVMIMNPTRCEC